MTKRKGVAISYGDIAPEAKENFTPSTNESEFDTLDQLRQYNLSFPNYANPCELYQTVLDGTAVAVPSVPSQGNIGLWSKQISEDNGVFENPIILTLTSEGNYTSNGLTLTFDTENEIYPTNLNVSWYRVFEGTETYLDGMDFYPNSSVYYCDKKVEAYNKIVITFFALNMPKNRLKLRSIDYGVGTFFYGKDLRNVKLIQEIDPISTQIVINTVDFTLDVDGDSGYYFQEKQPLSIYFNGELKATTFVKTAKRKAKFLYQIQSEDYIGLMDGSTYYGGIYVNENATDIIEDIFNTAKVPYRIDGVFENVTVSGYIPYTTCREALMQVAFAIQAVVDTSNLDCVNVYALDNSISQKIPLERIMQGQNFVDEETVKTVELSAHSYKSIAETIDVYDANESGTGQNIFVKFSEPLHDLSITNGTITQRHTNFAVINANTGCVLKGQKYEHTTQIHRMNNPLVLSNETEKVVAIENATLISRHNVDNVLEKCYNWLVKTRTTNLKIVEGKHIVETSLSTYGTILYGSSFYGSKSISTIYDSPVSVGENIEVGTEYLGDVSGRVIKQTFNLNGGIIIKETALK